MKRIKRFFLLFPILLALALTGCPMGTSPYYNESRIRDILYYMKRSFNEHDIDGLMRYIHPDYLHDGMTRWEVRELWLDRMAEYLLIDFENVQVVIDNDEAYVSFTMKLMKEFESVYSNEPSAHGDCSYFIYDHGDWSVYGNQYYFK